MLDRKSEALTRGAAKFMSIYWATTIAVADSAQTKIAVDVDEGADDETGVKLWAENGGIFLVVYQPASFLDGRDDDLDIGRTRILNFKTEGYTHLERAEPVQIMYIPEELSLFFLVVKTNVDHQVAGTFVTENENTESNRWRLLYSRDGTPN